MKTPRCQSTYGYGRCVRPTHHRGDHRNGADETWPRRDRRRRTVPDLPRLSINGKVIKTDSVSMTRDIDIDPDLPMAKQYVPTLMNWTIRFRALGPFVPDPGEVYRVRMRPHRRAISNTNPEYRGKAIWRGEGEANVETNYRPVWTLHGDGTLIRVGTPR